MDKIAPYKSIQHIVEAGMLECPCTAIICDMCMYHDFCSFVNKAFTEARKLSETNETIKGIMDEAREKRRKEILEKKKQHQEGENK